MFAKVYFCKLFRSDWLAKVYVREMQKFREKFGSQKFLPFKVFVFVNPTLLIMTVQHTANVDYFNNVGTLSGRV